MTNDLITQARMDRELRRLAESLPDEEMPEESFNRIWRGIERSLNPSPMKKIMTYLSKNIQPLIIGALFGILVTAVCIKIALSILFPC